MNLPRALLAFCLAIAVSSYSHAAGVAHFLALQGDGTASVFLDTQSATAFIHDGGHSGPKGIAGAMIKGQPILAYLLGQQIDSLVISCSHPHGDHMGGVETIIRSDDILKFKGGVTVIDAIPKDRTLRPRNSKGEPIDRLDEIYREAHGDNTGQAFKYLSAQNNDAFAELPEKPRDLIAHNYVYQPEKLSTKTKDRSKIHPHDASLIMSYEIKGDDNQALFAADFDDASTRLIKKWNEDNAGKPLNAVIVSHHGSRYNDMGPVLAEAKDRNLRYVIFTVNAGNRFEHPTPESLIAAIAAVGPDGVIVTGSETGDNVEITGSGIEFSEGKTPPRERLRRLLEVRHQENRKVRDTSLDANEIARAAQDEAGLLAVELSMRFSSDRQTDATGGAAFEQRVARAQESAARNERRNGDEPGLPGMTTTDPDGNGGGGGMPGGGPGRGSPGTSSPGVGSPGGAEALRNGGPSGFRYATYRTLRAEAVPSIGGVLMGSEPHGPKLTSARFETKEDGVRLVVSDGAKTATYGPISATEAWAAVNFIQPTEALRQRHPTLKVLGDAGALVGMDHNLGRGWQFAINPAIADTSIASDAMRLDLSVSHAQTESDTHPSVSLLPWPKPDSWDTYQWFDSEADISLGSGQVVVSARDAPSSSCIMRLRLILLRESQTDGVSDEAMQKETEATLATVKGIDQLSVVDQIRVITAIGARVRARHLQNSPRPDITAPTNDTDQLCAALPFLQRINSLAKTIAVLHLYRDSTDGDLPLLPQSIQPEWIPIGNFMKYEDVFADVH